MGNGIASLSVILLERVCIVIPGLMDCVLNCYLIESMLVVIAEEGTASLTVILLEMDSIPWVMDCFLNCYLIGKDVDRNLWGGDCVLNCYLIGKDVESNLWGGGLRP